MLQSYEKKSIHPTVCNENSRTLCGAGVFCVSSKKETQNLFFVFADSVLVAAHELIYAAGGVNQFGFAGVERMRRTRNFEFYQRISYPINVDGFFRSDSGTRDEHLFVRHIFECHGTIAFWMNSFFHCLISC